MERARTISAAYAGVISVNPGRKTLGEMNESEIRLAAITRALASSHKRSLSFKRFINFMSGVNSSVNRCQSIKTIAIRMICGGMFLALGIYSALRGGFTAVPMAAIIAGSSIILGLFTRIVSAAGAIFFGIIATQSIITGEIESLMLLSSVTLAASAILGPGRFSLDAIFRHLILKGASRARRRKLAKAREEQKGFSYRAFEMIDRQVAGL